MTLCLLTQYVQSGRAARDLKADGKKKGGMKAGKKHVMELPTNVPRLRSGRLLGDLNKDGKLSGYEKARQRAIQKNMAKKKKKRHVHRVEADIRKWSAEFLEIPNEKLNGLPPCPLHCQVKLGWTIRSNL